MSTGTKLFLLVGCLVVIGLEAPATFASLAAGWRGPYARQALALVPPPDVPDLGHGHPLAPPVLADDSRTRIARR